MSALRTLQTKYLKSGDIVGYIKILDEIPKESMIMLLDLMPVEFDFGATVEMAIIRHHEVKPFLTQLPKYVLIYLVYRRIKKGARK